MAPLTTDTFFNGRIQVKQHQAGYRFSIDAVILARHARPQADDTVVDLGTGCGIIPLILAYRHPGIKIYGIEVQKELADIAVKNVAENFLEDRICIHYRDMKTLKHDMISGPVDLIVSNPPYRKARSGRINPHQQRAVARHEIEVTLYDVLETARRMLRVAGRCVMIYTAERLTDMLTHMRSAGIEPKSIRLIHSAKHLAAKLILVEGKKGGRSGLKVGPPLIIYREDGSYSEEVQEMFMP
jgi:tRNA1Val (adenine37-N6)-methyltransferase